MNSERNTAIDQAVDWLLSAQKVVAFTGAGVSTESGIPDFRSATGLWKRFNPMEYATLGAFRANPEKVWKMIAALEELLEAQPNAGHRALADLEAQNGLAGIITQNIDGLHQAAGSRLVVEYHGSHRTFSCMSCGTGYPRAEVADLGMPPRCAQVQDGRSCAAILKPDVVLFDELIPQEAIRGSEALVRGADLMWVLGSSCEVYPAAALPSAVRDQGGRIIEINLQPEPGVDADLSLSGKFSEVMTEVVARWKARKASR